MFLKKQDFDSDFIEFKKKLNLIETGQKDIIKKIKENHAEVNHLRDKMDLIISQNDVLVNFKSTLTEIIDLKERFRKQIDTFKVLENRLENKVFDELKIQLNEQLTNLMHTTRRYKELEQSLVENNQKIKSLETEITKFMEISKTVKKMDFQLVNYTNKILSEDNEKLRLMRENEKLKKIIAKSRQNKTY